MSATTATATAALGHADMVHVTVTRPGDRTRPARLTLVSDQGSVTVDGWLGDLEQLAAAITRAVSDARHASRTTI